ncbi:hypothetical protein TrRE_jg6965 [Triparma retinervis]|uniref:Uncharacterized protein n=1 Tax=Triparma retinervis TaxID=2557542 RepID=A0A9W7DTZ1_9STRA|nr:hypothetical protein TrRE_jg6965 [Triparma retinervis]
MGLGDELKEEYLSISDGHTNIYDLASSLGYQADLICTNWKILGGVNCKTKHWPDTSASCLEINWSSRTPSMSLYHRESPSEISDTQIRDTEVYVDETLAGLGLRLFT